MTPVGFARRGLAESSSPTMGHRSRARRSVPARERAAGAAWTHVWVKIPSPLIRAHRIEVPDPGIDCRIGSRYRDWPPCGPKWASRVPLARRWSARCGLRRAAMVPMARWLQRLLLRGWSAPAGSPCGMVCKAAAARYAIATWRPRRRSERSPGLRHGPTVFVERMDSFLRNAFPISGMRVRNAGNRARA